MADPISIVTGVAGLIKASYDITKLLTSFIGSMKDAPAQASNAVSEISEMRTILGQLQSFLFRFEKADRSRTALVEVDQFVDVISGCVAIFSELEAALDKIVGSSMTLVGRARWVMWDEEKITDLVGRLQRHKSSLSLLVIILTGETQLAMWDSMERRVMAADMSYAAELERLHLEDNESDIFQTTVGPQASLDSDANSVVTVIHNPRESDLIPEMQGHFDFEPDLKRSRPYRAICLEATTSTISLTETNMRGWSFLSGYSLADVSNISILSLNISISELHNPTHYDQPDEHSLLGKRNSRAEVLEQHSVKSKGKGSRLKDTWSLGMANARAILYNKPTPATLLDLGLRYVKQNKLLEAEVGLRLALAEYENILGSDHNSTLNTVYNLAHVYRKQDNLLKAEAMYKRALVGWEKVLGPEHISTLNAVHSLGFLYGKQDRLVEAEAMYERALAGREKILGTEHESTLSTIHNIGFLYAKQDRLVEAEAMYRLALAGKERTLGRRHKSTLNTVHKLELLTGTKFN